MTFTVRMNMNGENTRKSFYMRFRPGGTLQRVGHEFGWTSPTATPCSRPGTIARALVKADHQER